MSDLEMEISLDVDTLSYSNINCHMTALKSLTLLLDKIDNETID